MNPNVSPIAGGSSEPVLWGGIPFPTPKDWIGLYTSPGATDGAFFAWRYTDSTSTGQELERFLIPAGTAPGTTYQFRLFANDGFTKLATSGSLTVT